MSREPSIYRPEQLPTIQHACQKQGIGGELPVFGTSERMRRVIFWCLRVFKGWRRPGQGSRIRRVMIFQHERIGDYVLTTPLYAWLRREYPDVHIDVICSRTNHPLVSADPGVRRAHAMSPRRGLHAGLWSAIRFLRSDTYDAVFVPTFTARTRSAVLIAMMKGAPQTATFSDPTRAYRYLGFFDTVRTRNRPFEHVSTSVSAIGPALLGGRQDLPNPYVPNVARRSGRPVEPHTIVIAVESADVRRSWTWQQACRLAEMLLEDHAEVCVVLVSPLRSIVEEPAYHPRRRVWRGTLPQLADLVGEASALVAANSAVVHLAAAAGTPVVGLYNSEENAAEWYPVGVKYRLILPGEGRSVADVDAATVMNGLRDLLRDRPV